MERFFRSFKTEWMPKGGYATYEQAEREILRYIHDYYNTVRPHSYNGYVAPSVAEKLTGPKNV